MTGKTNLSTYVKDVIEWAEQLKIMLYNRSFEEENIELYRQRVDDFLFSLKVKKDQVDESIVREINLMANELYEEGQRLLLKRYDSHSELERQVPLGQHSLPPLPYGYDALEPYISQDIMRLHHDKHHKSYVDGLNKAEKMMAQARETGDFSLVKHWEREAAFHGSGHYLHTIFWNVMSPQGGGKPSGRLLKQINQDFGSFDAFKKHFSEAAKAVEGVGWAILVWAPRSHRLEILQSERHQLMTQWDTIPLLVLDVWEHAYYLQYQNNRGEYVDNWWNIVNWREVEKRYNESSKVKWQPY